MDERLIAAAVLNMARMWETPARTMGRRWIHWEDAWAADCALPSRMFNRATITRRLDPSAAPGLAHRITQFFGASPDDGEYLVNDPWAAVDLEPHGFARWWTLPFMLRPAGGAPDGDTTDVEIREVRSKNEVEVFVNVLVQAFDLPSLVDVPASQVLDQRVLEEGAMRCWVAFANGQPVGISVAHASDGIVGVYLVGVVPSMRRRGLGEALTWRATLSDGAAPSSLQASALGRPVYERMGYATALECATWVRSVR